MCRRFASLHIAHWRDAKRNGLPKSAARSRQTALWWLSQARAKA